VIFIGDTPTPLLQTRAIQWENPEGHALTRLEPAPDDFDPPAKRKKP
jgi:hypothetical protein